MSEASLNEQEQDQVNRRLSSLRQGGSAVGIEFGQKSYRTLIYQVEVIFNESNP